jgi:hypothetical protein
MPDLIFYLINAQGTLSGLCPLSSPGRFHEVTCLRCVATRMLFSMSCTAYVAAPRKISQLSRRANNAPRMVGSWYDSGLRLDGSVADIRMTADGVESLDGAAAALDALDALDARLDAATDAVAPEAETNFYSFLNSEMNAVTAAAAAGAPAENPPQQPPPTPSPPASAAPASAAVAGLPELKASFRLESAQCDRGLSASGASIERLQGMALELEAAAREDPRWTGGSAVTASPLLLGKWYLDFCDAADVRGLSA